MKRKPLLVCLAVIVVGSIWQSVKILCGLINNFKNINLFESEKEYINACIYSGVSFFISFLFLIFSLIFIYLLTKREHILLSKEEIEAKKQNRIQKRERKKQAKIKKLQNDIEKIKKEI